MQVKVLTLNVWNGGKIWNNLEQFLKNNSFDIMFFQEVFNGHGADLPKSYKTLDEFQELFPGYYFHFAPAFGDIGEYGAIDRGSAIFSKFPITSSEITFFDLPYRVFEEQKHRNYEKTPRALEHCEVTCGTVSLNLFNHHGIWGRDGKDNPRRIMSGKTIVEKMKKCKNVVLAGDFNMSLGTETIRLIENRLKNIFGTTLKSTFNMNRKDDPGYATAAVDMMFVSPNIRIIEKECPDVDVSDHLPLTATLELGL